MTKGLGKAGIGQVGLGRAFDLREWYRGMGAISCFPGPEDLKF
jgi:hypothetical protein